MSRSMYAVCQAIVDIPCRNTYLTDGLDVISSTRAFRLIANVESGIKSTTTAVMNIMPKEWMKEVVPPRVSFADALWNLKAPPPKLVKDEILRGMRSMQTKADCADNQSTQIQQNSFNGQLAKFTRKRQNTGSDVMESDVGDIYTDSGHVADHF